MVWIAVSIEDRFWSRVDRRGDDECWPWLGTEGHWGYGVISRGKGKGNEYTHRLAWRIANGVIPDGMFVCHRCDNPPCVNPAHLFLGDSIANNADKASKDRGSEKLSRDDVRWLREWGACGWPQRLLAQAVGCRRDYVNRILMKRSRVYV